MPSAYCGGSRARPRSRYGCRQRPNGSARRAAASTAERYPWGDTLDRIARTFSSRSGRESRRGTAPVGSYPANGFHLHDMAGNVWEWVSDWYAPDYYERAQYLNPQGPDHGMMRIVRGGAWVNADGRYLRCAYRHKVPPDSYAYSIGFRVAYSLK